jgi:hypothetical protein
MQGVEGSERGDAESDTVAQASAQPEQPAPAANLSADISDDATETRDPLQDTGPTVVSGRWLGTQEHWLSSGSQRAVRPYTVPLSRPARFRQTPMWMSGVLLAGVAACAFIAVLMVAHTAPSYLPKHHAPTPVAQHTPTPKPKHTATPAHG